MKTVIVLVLVVLVAGCSATGNDAARLASLQKQLDTLSANVNEIEAAKTATTDFDLQSRCAAAAKRSFDAQVEDVAGTTTQFYPFTSNYNQTMGRCFVSYSTMTSFGQDVLTDVHVVDAIRGVEYGFYAESASGVKNCIVTWGGKRVRCTSHQQFDAYLTRYMGAVPW